LGRQNAPQGTLHQQPRKNLEDVLSRHKQHSVTTRKTGQGDGRNSKEERSSYEEYGSADEITVY